MGDSLYDACLYANKYCSITVQRDGTISSYPTAEEAEAIFNRKDMYDYILESKEAVRHIVDEQDELLKTALERDGHAVEIRTSGVTVTESLCRWADCILLDVMMPGEDGFATCRRIRAITQAPILFLTARTDEQSVLTGLGIGADDYLTKPFRVAELRARVAAHLRRQNRAPASRMVRGGIGFDLAAKTAMVGEQPLPFTRSEYAISEYLALHAGQTFSKEQIYEAVFGYDGTADDTAVTQHIKNIRAKLRTAGVAAPETVLKTIWGVGYQWKSET